MSVKLSEVQDLPPRAARKDEPLTDPLGIALASDVRAAVAKVCGGWGLSRSRTSDAERDALAQTLAVWALEHPQKVIGRQTHERRALYHSVLSRNLLTDSRLWQDSLEDRAVVRTRARTGDGKPRVMVLADDTASEQAKRYREAERESRAGEQAAKLTAAAEHEPGAPINLAAVLERDEDPAELAAHSRELAAALVDKIALKLDAIALTAKQREALAVAVLMAGGETLQAIALELGYGIATAKRRSTEGVSLIALACTAAELVAMRRDAVRELGMVDEREPASVAEVDRRYGIATARAAVDAVIARERERTAALLSGGCGERHEPRGRWQSAHTAAGAVALIRTGAPPEHRHGTARDVLAYIGRLERILSAPCRSLILTDARTVPAPPTASRPRPRRHRGGGSPRALAVLHYIDTAEHEPRAWNADNPGERQSVRYRLCAWTLAPLAGSNGKPRLANGWDQAMSERRRRAALTVARRIAKRHGTRAARVAAFAKLALAVIPGGDPVR